MNNLNYVTRNFKVVFDDVAKLKQQVYTEIQRVNDEQELKIRKNTEEIYQLQLQVTNIQDNLPQMVKEMVNFYGDHKLAPKLDLYVTKEDNSNQMKRKLDYIVFTDYTRRQQQIDQSDDKEFKIDQRFFAIEQALKTYVKADDFKSVVRTKASLEKHNEVKNNLAKLTSLVESYHEK